MIKSLGSDWSIKPDSIYLFTLDSYTRIMYKDRIILNVSEDDALWMTMSVDSIANIYRAKVVEKIHYLQKKNSLISISLRILEFIGVLLALFLFFKGLNYLIRKWKGYVKKYFIKLKFKPITLRNYKLLNEKQALKITFFAIDIVRYVIMLIVLIIAVPVLFFIFPQTRKLAETLLTYIVTPAKSIAYSIVNYIPNLFTIVIIWLLIHYVIKGLRYISKEIDGGRVVIP